jgi:hypothetical protein
MVSFTLRPLLLLGLEPPVCIETDWVGPRAVLKEKTFLKRRIPSLSEIEHGTSDFQSRY